MRTYKKKTTRGSEDAELFEEATKAIIDQKLSLRKAAKVFNINFMTLSRYLKRKRACDEGSSSRTQLIGYARHRQIFSDDMEARLEECITNCNRIYYGLTSKDIRTLAHEYAVASKIQYPQKWDEAGMASEDWLSGFLRRHPNLSLRTPETISLASATNLNVHNVAQFYANLNDLFQRYKFVGHQVENVDETTVSTVKKPSKVVAERDKKQIGPATSGEKG